MALEAATACTKSGEFRAKLGGDEIAAQSVADYEHGAAP